MLRWYRNTCAAAGFSRKASGWLLVVAALACLFVGSAALQISHVPAFSLSVTAILFAFILEWLTIRARARRRNVAQAWPEVLDALLSASSSGLPLFEAFIELSSTGPVVLRHHFKALERDLDAGLDLNDGLRNLRDSMADVNVDRLVELVRIVTDSGGQGFHIALRSQAVLARQDLALAGELESKQGWVSGTAKVAIMAPWLVVVMLCARKENIVAYSNPQGAAILLTGLIVSIIAYRLIQLFGSFSEPVRVFDR
jgi:tight adherence protein B